jgi:hypothetical protein
VIQPTPDLTRPQPAAEGPVCGWDDTLGHAALPCGQPADHHILLTPRVAVLLCDPHMRQTAAAHVWHDRHPARPACAHDGHTWQPDRCTTPDTTTKET